MADHAITPGSVTEAYEKTAATPGPNKHDGGAGGGKRRGCAPLTVANSLIGAGALLAVVAVVYGAALPSVITSKIEGGVATCKVEDVQKEAFTDNYGDCKDCTPYYYNLNMFNVTNAMEYLEKGDKLKMTEVGPYAYRRRQKKVDVKLSDDKNQISYKLYTYHTFDETKSCTGCKDTDQVISMDLGYMNVISQAGGELGFLRRLVAGTLWGKDMNASDREVIVQANKAQMMKWANGLNSNYPPAWKKLSSTVLGFLGGGVETITKLELEGFEYNGVFAKRPISDWALGAPSMLAGIGLGTNYKNICLAGLNDKCAKCTAATCPEIWSECKKCATGAKIFAISSTVCARIVKKYTDFYGDVKLASEVNSTCGLCDMFGVCAAPLPGAAEGSGLDYSKTAPPTSILNEYVQKTGCDDFKHIGEYVKYDGFTSQPVWTKLDSRRNPTLAELGAFSAYANCDAKLPNVTCSDVVGNDGTSTPPGGAGISGFAGEVTLKETIMYLIQAKQNITLYNTGKSLDLDGAKLVRFSPPNDLLTYDEVKAVKGTAFPVDGVQSMAFNVGFLAFVSYPLYLFGDKSLLEAIDVTMWNGKVASKDMMYDAQGNLLEEYYNRYQTLVDVEPGTGKAMRARKRLMASYALAKSQFTPNAPMSDVLWPKLKPEVIMPAYFGEESATITSTRLKTYTTIKGLLSSLLPVLIVGLVLGVALVAFGFVKRRRAAAAQQANYGNAV